MTHLRRATPIFTALLLGCGALETPDLQHGVVTGQIQLSGTPLEQPYVYVLGSPDAHAQVEPDGSFRLDGVPIGQPRIVLFDGNEGCESVQVQVQGETESRMVSLGRPLDRAGGILASANPASGVSTAQLTFTVQGAYRLQGVSGSAGARLWPLPAGRFTVHADLPGHRDSSVTIDVAEGTDFAEIMSLDIDSESNFPGCNGCGGCESGLTCASDGECVECSSSSDCTSAAAGVCDEGRCRYPGAGTYCQACNAANGTADCAPGTGVACLTVNAGGGTVSGYCSYACGSCPAGYRCNDSRCEPLVSCTALEATFGSSCSTDDPCKAVLQDAQCYHPPSGQAYCTAKCTAPGDCPKGWSCIGDLCAK